MYYYGSGNKGADQLHCVRAADLHLCFHICKKAGFHDTVSIFPYWYLEIMSDTISAPARI